MVGSYSCPCHQSFPLLRTLSQALLCSTGILPGTGLLLVFLWAKLVDEQMVVLERPGPATDTTETDCLPAQGG